MFVNLMAGLGDTIFARPIVRALAGGRGDVYVRTAWPQIIGDLGYPLATRSQLRTQAKNLARSIFPKPVIPTPPSVHPRYGPRELREGLTILSALEKTSGANLGPRVTMDLPEFDPPVLANVRGKPVAVVRPSTVRREWPNSSRNPGEPYLRQAVAMLRARGFHVVSVADVAPPLERRSGDILPADEWFDHGELVVEELIGLVQSASIVVGGIGFIVPMCLATKTPAIFIGGGQGAYNAPGVVADRRVDQSHVRFILPDHYCLCEGMNHDCPKEISGFRALFDSALDELVAEVVA